MFKPYVELKTSDYLFDWVMLGINYHHEPHNFINHYEEWEITIELIFFSIHLGVRRK